MKNKADAFERRKAYKSRMRKAAKEMQVAYGKETCLNLWDSLGQTRCAYCCRKMTKRILQPNSRTFDHIVPSCRGGTTDFQNSLICCYDCNQRKDDMSLTEFATKYNLPRKEWLIKKDKEANTYLRRLRHMSRVVECGRPIRPAERKLIEPTALLIRTMPTAGARPGKSGALKAQPGHLPALNAQVCT